MIETDTKLWSLTFMRHIWHFGISRSFSVYSGWSVNNGQHATHQT